MTRWRNSPLSRHRSVARTRPRTRSWTPDGSTPLTRSMVGGSSTEDAKAGSAANATPAASIAVVASSIRGGVHDADLEPDAGPDPGLVDRHADLAVGDRDEIAGGVAQRRPAQAQGLDLAD